MWQILHILELRAHCNMRPGTGCGRLVEENFKIMKPQTHRRKFQNQEAASEFTIKSADFFTKSKCQHGPIWLLWEALEPEKQRGSHKLNAPQQFYLSDLRKSLTKSFVFRRAHRRAKCALCDGTRWRNFASDFCRATFGEVRWKRAMKTLPLVVVACGLSGMWNCSIMYAQIHILNFDRTCMRCLDVLSVLPACQAGAFWNRDCT